VLRARGLLIGTIDSLSSAFCDTPGLIRSPGVDPNAVGNHRIEDESLLFDSLARTLLSFNDLVSGRSVGSGRKVVRIFLEMASKAPSSFWPLEVDSIDSPQFSVAGQTFTWRGLSEEEKLDRTVPLTFDVAKRLRFCTALIKEERLRIVFSRGTGFGWAHPATQLGDHIYLFNGCTMPVILRPVEGRASTFKLVGRAYMDDTMNNRFRDSLASYPPWVEMC
jgi:hypothetical protein